ncbi:MAG: helix-turn-helix transcriptional regulator [Bacteroidales bacterium]|nr:helix-turn-helix transcriptional regulator [Bacteroidales bacterium]
MSFFGINLKKIRAVKKLSQTEFAELFDLTRSAVGAYEEGRAEAKIDKVIEIAEYYGLTLDQFFKKKLTLNEIFHYDKKKDVLQFDNKYNPISYVESSKVNQYLKNSDNKEFIDRLPKISLPETEKNFRAFEVRNVNHFLDGDVLVCEQVENKIIEESFYLLISDDGLIITDRIPGKKHFKEIWAVKTIISRNSAKFKIIEQLKEISGKLG